MTTNVRADQEIVKLTEQGGYEAVIGLEVHAQLLTETKIFCGCRAAYGHPPNSLTCPVCLGLPGSLPVLNRQAVELALRMVVASGGEVMPCSQFARKNYFYPDLPKGYQITQYDRPIGNGGEIRYRTKDGEKKRCHLLRIHLEEDAGKLIHPEGDEWYTKVDLNRCGTPLIEIVTQPELRSPADAYGFLKTIRQMVQYLEVCTADMEKGELRVDANVSIRPVGQAEMGIRTEVKNMNSFRAVERALSCEIERQVSLVSSGGEVSQATLLWDEDAQTVRQMRSKEEAEDYRYFPDPDLVDLIIDKDWVERVRSTLPELAGARAVRFTEQYGIRDSDATILTDSRGLAEFFEEVMGRFEDGQVAANWILTEVIGQLNGRGEGIDDCKLHPSMLAELLRFVDSGDITGKTGKSVLAKMIETGQQPGNIIEGEGLAQISDESKLTPIIKRILNNNTEEVERYRTGKLNLIVFFVGQVMNETKGRANPEVVNRLLRKLLDG